MSDEIDHLFEATQHVRATPLQPSDHFIRSQAHALIAIAQELKRFNDRQENPPRSMDYDVQLQNNLRVARQEQKLWEGLGKWLSRYNTCGHQ